jgi:glycosyltransferase involved in cell wall biosynthesis
MKVLHILDSLNRGGAEMLALDVCRNARANNLDLTFVATGGGDLEDDFRRSGARFIRLQRKIAIDPLVIARLRRIIFEQNIEIVHSHQAVEATHAYFAALGTKAKLVMSFHLCAADRKNRAALKLLAPRMDANVCVSHDLLQCLEERKGFDTRKNFSVIYNGVDEKRLPRTSGALRAQLGLQEQDILLGMIGNFYSGARKDQLTICRALPQTFSQFPRAHFVFVGGYPAAAPQRFKECVDYCRAQRLTDRVHFPGKLSNVPDVLSSLDLFVFSSRQEGLPISVIEALLMGVPVIVSDIKPLLEVTGGGRYAETFRTGDSDDLAHKLSKLLNNRTQSARLSSEAQRWAAKQFSIEAHLSGLKNLYASLLRQESAAKKRQASATNFSAR